MSTRKPTPKFKLPDIQYTPANTLQREAREKWKDSKIMVLLGCAGLGKSTIALSECLIDLQKLNKRRLILSRPSIETEKFGFEPGDLNEKLLTWQGPMMDVFEGVSDDDLTKFLTAPNTPIKMLPVGRMKGRTIRDANMIVDEAQDLTIGQLKTLLTRVGHNGRLILSGDLAQSDLGIYPVPLKRVVDTYAGLEGFTVIVGNPAENLRDPWIQKITDRFSSL